MEMITIDNNGVSERVYCPSTDEVIYDEFDGMRYEAEAFIAYWDSLSYERPLVKDDQLEAAWNQYLNDSNELTHKRIQWKNMEAFLKGYENPSLIAYCWDFSKLSDRGSGYWLFFVAKAGTIIEKSPGKSKEE